MNATENASSLETLQDIRSIMERSARFISLSGWSGVWAGGVGLAGSFIAKMWLDALAISTAGEDYNLATEKFLGLALVVLIAALAGGYFFTWRKAKKDGVSLFSSASRKMMLQMAIPLAAGGLFSLSFLYDQHDNYIAPACLVFYGLALINGSKYTLSDIKYLGLCEVALGCVCMFLKGYGLLFWAIGFGVLHIVYGFIMWNKYDKQAGKKGAL